jgi:hypothetical protein
VYLSSCTIGPETGNADGRLSLHIASGAVPPMVTIRMSTVAVLLGLVASPLHAAEQTGNRMNWKDYQPTPAEVIPAEKQAGVEPSAARDQAENRDVESIDRDALRREGMSTQSVPNLTDSQPKH